MSRERKAPDPRRSDPRAFEPSPAMPPDEEQFAPPEEEPTVRMGEIVGKVRENWLAFLHEKPDGPDIGQKRRREYLTGYDYGKGTQIVYPDRREQLPEHLLAHNLHAQDFLAIGMDTPDLGVLLDDPTADISWKTATKMKASKTFWGEE